MAITSLNQGGPGTGPARTTKPNQRRKLAVSRNLEHCADAANPALRGGAVQIAVGSLHQAANGCRAVLVIERVEACERAISGHPEDRAPAAIGAPSSGGSIKSPIAGLEHSVAGVSPIGVV